MSCRFIVQEDSVLGQARQEAKEFIKQLQDEELARNLRRVQEVRRYANTILHFVEDEIELEQEMTDTPSVDPQGDQQTVQTT